MIDPGPDDYGRRVIYTPPGDYPGKKVEEGVISSITPNYVFVRFGLGGEGVACFRANLEWVNS